MRAALLIGHGGPDKIVVRDDVRRPTPGPGEVEIAVSACGMNNTDINTRIGWYSSAVVAATEEPASGEIVETVGWNGALAFPRIQGVDICGTVVGVGSPEDRGLIGQRVIVDPWIRVNDDPTDSAAAGYVGSECDGGFAEFACLPTANIHPISSPLTDVELASFPCSAATALNMLERVRVSATDTVVVTGASGGVGSFAVQLAHGRGARVIAIAGAAKRDGVIDLGADLVIDRGAANLGDAIRAAAGGSVDVVVDVVGGRAQFPALIDALGPRGRFVTAGAIAGPIVDLDLRSMYLRDLELHGVTSFPPSLFSDLVRLIETGGIRPVVGAVFPLERIHAAQAAFGAKRHLGTIVVAVGDRGTAESVTARPYSTDGARREATG